MPFDACAQLRARELSLAEARRSAAANDFPETGHPYGVTQYKHRQLPAVLGRADLICNARDLARTEVKARYARHDHKADGD